MEIISQYQERDSGEAIVFLAAFALAPDEISGIHLGYWFAGLFVSINLVLVGWVLVLWFREIRD